MATMTVLSQGFWRVSGERIGFGANRPVSPVQKIADRLHAKPFGLGNVLNLLASRTAADKVSRHFARDLGQSVTVFSTDTLATLRDFVGHVLGLRPKPQVVRVDASGRVASVQDAHSSRNVGMVDGVRVSVSQELGVFACAKEAVTARVSRAIPNPAITALIDVAEKTNGWVFGLSRHEATLAFSEVV